MRRSLASRHRPAHVSLGMVRCAFEANRLATLSDVTWGQLCPQFSGLQPQSCASSSCPKDT
eukprot:3191046-Amphidinium_carterae.1